MLQDNWHFIAFSALCSVLALQTSVLLFFGLLFCWIVYLYVFERITIVISLLTILSFFLFYVYLPSYERDYIPLAEEIIKPFTVSGHIVGTVANTEKHLSFILELEETKERLNVTYFYPNSSTEALAFPYTHRAQCTITGLLEQPEEATNPFQFNYRKYLYEQGIVANLFVDDLSHITCQQKRSLTSFIFQLRDWLIKMANEKLHAQIVPWQQALLFGETDQLDEVTEARFQRWGLSHLLAISGLHVGIIIAIAYFILVRFFQVTKEKANLSVLLFLPVYALLAGGQPSVWRASLMTIVVLLLGMRRLNISRLDLLSIVFLLLVFVDPFLIYHIGFQFSFIVTFGLILSANWFAQSLSYFQVVLRISFIAQMIIVPLQMYHFYHFQPLSILLNVLIVPYFSLFVIPSMFFFLVHYTLPFSLGKLFERLFLFIHEIVLQALAYIDHYFNTPFISGEITLPIAFLYYILLALMMTYLEKDWKRIAFLCGFGISLLLTFVIVQPYLNKTGTVTMLDVGQGRRLCH